MQCRRALRIVVLDYERDGTILDGPETKNPLGW